ncbi:MAG TPA: RpiB/LacA/LacB family sugar-phosphate isomerase, partial [Propionibacteriaceae bacterium]|nr:RpiB/LacA/LacB family sugar-phosphate isomerase [Propionibacteriaceae bacterium]
MSGPIRLLVGSDSAGFDYKDRILADMQADDRVEVVDLGVFQGDLDGASYPSVAIAAGRKIAAGEADRAILVCGTGIGVAIAANKVPG